MDCSIIIPFCNEMPQVAFTVQSLIEELEGFCEYEIILVDNMSNENIVCKAGERIYPTFSRNYFFSSEKGHRLNTLFVRQGKIKYFIYDEKQGHWNAKNYGIKQSTGKYLFFLDSHCIMKRDSLRKMIEFLRNPPEEKIGAVHAYICYMLDSHRLEYKVQPKFFGYQFCSAQKRTEPYKVCVMTTCGMLVPRSTIDELGAWNPELGIYGGGESYINWKQSTCGYSHWIHNEAVCWHFADKRGYSWNHTDYVRNSFIAAYCVGGEKWLNQQAELRKAKERPKAIDELVADVSFNCRADREFIQSKQIISFDDYISYWERNPGIWK